MTAMRSPRSIEALHTQRPEILQNIAPLPPFHRGVISEHRRTSGQPDGKPQRSAKDRSQGSLWTAPPSRGSQFRSIFIWTGGGRVP